MDVTHFKELAMKFEDFKLDPDFTDGQVDQYKTYFDDIFIKNEYENCGILIEKNDIVVDCGASIGLFSRYAVEKKAKKVYAFEADKQVFKTLQLNVDKIPKITAVNAVITHPNVDVAADNFSSESYDLDRILSEFKLTKIDYLKLDVEGCEYGFLLNASEESLLKVKKWAIEIHVCGFLKSLDQEYEFVLRILNKFSKLNYTTTLIKFHEDTCNWNLYMSKR